MQRIRADFNTMNQDLWGQDRRILLGCDAVLSEPEEGLRVLIGDEDLEVEAILEYDRERGVWWARPDWTTRRDLLGESSPPAGPAW